MATTFYVVMLKRNDGKVYPDLHKTSEWIHCDRHSAEHDLAVRNDPSKWHIVELVAMTPEEYKQPESLLAQARCLLENDLAYALNNKVLPDSVIHRRLSFMEELDNFLNNARYS